MGLIAADRSGATLDDQDRAAPELAGNELTAGVYRCPAGRDGTMTALPDLVWQGACSEWRAVTRREINWSTSGLDRWISSCEEGL